MATEPRRLPVEEYGVMYRVEDTHWWYCGMEAITRRVIERHYPRSGSLRILDAGCGTGAVMGYLAEYGTVSGIDYAAEALRFCRLRGRERLTQGSVMSLPYRDARFDLVASFDVMSQYGVTDDDAALREFARVLAPGGRLLLRLPAFKWMRGQHDTAADVEKRYVVPQVKAKLHAVGLVCERASYANTFLFPLAAAKRFAERFSPPQSCSDLTMDTGPFNAVLRAVLAAEAPLVAGCGLPYGLTIVALARKTSA